MLGARPGGCQNEDQVCEGPQVSNQSNRRYRKFDRGEVLEKQNLFRSYKEPNIRKDELTGSYTPAPGQTTSTSPSSFSATVNMRSSWFHSRTSVC